MIATQDQIRTIAELEQFIPKHMEPFAQILQVTQGEDDVIQVEYVVRAKEIYPINDGDLYINLTFEINTDGAWGSFIRLVKIA